MKITARELAAQLDGTVEGDPEVVITKPGRIEDAEKGALTFLANPRYEKYLYSTRASAVLVDSNFRAKKKIQPTLIRVEDVYSAMAKLTEYLSRDEYYQEGIHPTAIVHESAKVPDNASVGAFTFIGPESVIGEWCVILPHVYIGKNVQVGEKTWLMPGVRVYRDTNIGSGCIIHANAVIGSDGFGFVPQQDGSYKKMNQLGNVIMKDNVEIGANTVIDRGSIGSTVIEEGVKLDNLIQIAHNVKIGAHTVIAAQAGIAGSTTIGQWSRVGGQTGIAGHLELGEKMEIQAQSGVGKSHPEGQKRLYGTPAIDYNNYLRAYAYFKTLPELVERIKALEESASLGKGSEKA